MSKALARREASLPTYRTIAEVLEKKTGSGWKLLGWTLARTIMIAPPMLLAHKLMPDAAPWKKIFVGAAMSSVFISLFALIRIYNAEFTLARGYFSGRRWAKKKLQPPRGMKRIA